jgi:hypothetical protein
MMKFKLDGIEYNLPDFISIDNYVKIFKMKDIFSDEYFAAKLLSTLSGAKFEDLLEADFQEINYLASYIMSLIPTEKPEFVDRFEIDGVSYGFFPDWTQLTFAEFVDMDTISTKKADELLNLLHILAAIMYRPIVEETSKHDFKIEKYDVDKMKQRAELFKTKLDVKYILGAQFFFINYANKFSDYTQISLIPKLSIWKKIKLTWMMRKWIWAAIFKKPLVGSLSSTEFLKTILQNTNISSKRV